ncbi:MAG: hypothetical protein ACRETR_11725, partial [Steroidobacteraceae bacterium]
MTLCRQRLIPAALLVLATVAGAVQPCRAAAGSAAPQPFRSFKVTVYIPVQVVEHMAQDPAW